MGNISNCSFDGRIARLTLFAIAMAALLVAIMPMHAWAWSGWYKVWTVDQNGEAESVIFSWDSEGGASQAAVEVGVDVLQRGFIFESYYDGTVDPLPSSMGDGGSYPPHAAINCADSATGASMLNMEGGWNKQEHTRTADAFGNPSYVSDANGYYNGISHCVVFWNLNTISVGESLSFTAYITPYIAGFGSSKANAVGLQAFTLVAGEDSDDSDNPDDPENPKEPVTPVTPVEPDTPEDPSDSDEPNDPGDSGNPENPTEPTEPGDSTDPSKPVDPVTPDTPSDSDESDQSVDSDSTPNQGEEEDPSQTTPLSPVSETPVQSAASDENVGNSGATKGVSNNLRDDSSDGVTQTLESEISSVSDGRISSNGQGASQSNNSAAHLLSFASVDDGSNATQSKMVVTGLPVLFALVVAVLCATAPVAAAWRLVSRRFGAGRGSRLRA